MYNASGHMLDAGHFVYGAYMYIDPLYMPLKDVVRCEMWGAYLFQAQHSVPFYKCSQHPGTWTPEQVSRYLETWPDIWTLKHLSLWLGTKHLS